MEKKIKTSLIILVFIMLALPAVLAQTYEASTYYLKLSGNERAGAIIALDDGPSINTGNGKEIHFGFDLIPLTHTLNFAQSNSGGALIYSDLSHWFRIGSNNGLGFWGDGNYRAGDIPNLTIGKNGKIGIGNKVENISPSNLTNYNLFVTNGVLSEKYGLGPQASWADYVFKEDYNLRTLSDLEEYIRKNNHLPHVPSAKEIAEVGYNLHEMNVIFLEKIEELTLYVLKQDKEIEQLKKEIAIYTDILDRVNALENLMDR